jgi:hypothetical protein
MDEDEGEEERIGDIGMEITLASLSSILAAEVAVDQEKEIPFWTRRVALAFLGRKNMWSWCNLERSSYRF